jgi:hypothetical protein
MFFAAGCATSISRRIAFPSFVNLEQAETRQLARKSHAQLKLRFSSGLQNSTHGIEKHFEHCFRTQARTNDIRDRLRRCDV